MTGPHEVEHERWVRSAQDDLSAARVLIAHPSVAPNEVCVLCQQSVEKHLKAVLIARGIDVPRIHGLVELRALTGVRLAEEFDDEALEDLTRWLIVGRYPGDWCDATSHQATRSLGVAEGFASAVAEELRTDEQDRS